MCVAYGEIILVPRKIKGIWFLESGAVSRAYLDTFGFAWNRQRWVSSASSRDEEHEENGRQSLRPHSERRRIDLIPRSRATHITGFLDPNRRADDRFVRRPPIMHGEQSRLHAEALMRAKANNLLRNAPELI